MPMLNKDKSYKKTFWMILILFNVVILCLFALWLHSGNDYSVNQKQNSHLIGASYMTMNNEFYKIMSEEINAKVEAEGDRMILRDPALNADRQIEQIEEMLDMGIDMLVLTPVNWESLTSVLEKAKKQGVKIVVVDSNVTDDNLVDCTITSDNYDAGRIVGEYFLEQCDTAKVIIMTHETAKSGRDRVAGFVDAVSQKEGIEIVKEIECKGQLEIAMPKLQEEIESGTEFDNVFCLNDLASVGVVAALEEDNSLDQVGVYGVDGSPDAKALLGEGMMNASAVQFPSEIGSKAAEVMYQLFDGQSVEKNILIPVDLITKDNVEDFGVDRWQ